MTDNTQHAYAPIGHTGRCSVCSNVELHAFHQSAVASDPAAIDYLQGLKEDGATGLDMSPGNQNAAWAVQEIQALRGKADNAWNEAWDLAHEPARCGHVRANYKDPKFGTPEYKGNEKCEACAEVKALRERVAELEETSKYWMNEATAGVDGAKARITWKDRAEAAEAREAELVVALETALSQAEGCWLNHYGDNPEGSPVPEHIKMMHTALNATPPEALERARARDEVVERLRELLKIFALGPLGAAANYGPDFDLHAAEVAAAQNAIDDLAKLDALQSEELS